MTTKISLDAGDLVYLRLQHFSRLPIRDEFIVVPIRIEAVLPFDVDANGCSDCPSPVMRSPFHKVAQQTVFTQTPFDAAAPCGILELWRIDSPQGHGPSSDEILSA